MANTGQPQRQNKGRISIIRSSLPYQVLLYINAWYFGFFFLCEILIFIFKGETLPYAENVLPAEVILVFILAGIEALRIFFAQKGNLTERIAGVAVSILLSIPAILGAIFLLLWQTYVLRVDVILAAIQLAFLGLELIFGIISIITFARSSLLYQVLLYINAWYFGFFFLCEILIFIFKGETLPYAENVLPAEVILVFILAGIEALRIFFAQKGNLTERIAGVAVSILLSIPAILGAIFLLLWQTYVLRVDVILAAIQLAFLGLELIFGIISIITFARATPY